MLWNPDKNINSEQPWSATICPPNATQILSRCKSTPLLAGLHCGHMDSSPTQFWNPCFDLGNIVPAEIDAVSHHLLRSTVFASCSCHAGNSPSAVGAPPARGFPRLAALGNELSSSPNTCSRRLDRNAGANAARIHCKR